MLSIKYIKLPMSIFSSTLWFIISLLQHCLYTFSNSSSILTISLWYHFLFNWENRRKWKKVSASPLIASTPLLAFAALFSDSSPVIVSQWQSAHPLHSRCPALLPTQVHCSATLFTPSIINHFFSLGLFLVCEQTVYSSLKTKHINKIPLETTLLIAMSTSLLVEAIVYVLKELSVLTVLNLSPCPFCPKPTRVNVILHNTSTTILASVELRVPTLQADSLPSEPQGKPFEDIMLP